MALWSFRKAASHLVWTRARMPWHLDPDSSDNSLLDMAAPPTRPSPAIRNLGQPCWEGPHSPVAWLPGCCFLPFEVKRYDFRNSPAPEGKRSLVLALHIQPLLFDEDEEKTAELSTSPVVKVAGRKEQYSRGDQ